MIALSVITVVGVIAMHKFGGIIPAGSTSFPLDDCSKDEMDVLFLYFEDELGTTLFNERDFSARFADHLSRSPSNNFTQRVKFASVIDMYSVQDTLVNVSSWRMTTALPTEPYGHREKQRSVRQFKQLEEIIQLKIQFAERLFSEMCGVRERSVHVVVIFLDGAGLSFAESRSVPRIVQQTGTGLKVFVVVVGRQYGAEPVYLNDTLLVGNIGNYLHALTLALCDECMDGWFSLKHIGSTRSLSCYKFVGPDVNLSWGDVLNNCYTRHRGFLATIETPEKIVFLKEQLLLQFKQLSVRNDSFDNLHVHVFIGLIADPDSAVKRFKWQYYRFRDRFAPLVVNYWARDEPSGGPRRGCGVWRFQWYDSKDDVSNFFLNGSRFDDGWAEVSCNYSSRSFSLCEVSLPRRVADSNILSIRPARNESFFGTLNKTALSEFNGNIVSVSANIADNQFLGVFKETGKEFPVFDCGVDADRFRFISYLYVCDSINHCSNRRDEAYCAFLQGKTDRGVTMKKCFGLLCNQGSCLPLQWINDGEVDCLVNGGSANFNGTDEGQLLHFYLRRNETCAFICDEGECVHFSQLNNGYADCTGPNGPLDETVGKLETVDTCRRSLGHRVWAPRCVYVTDWTGSILGCRDLSHLENCASFECPEGYFKCPSTYCIPQHYVLDKIVDCPTGEEEQLDTIGKCTGNFACWDSQICLHPDLVCDGHPDCPHLDDEVDCNVTCADGLRCVSGTVTVADYNNSKYNAGISVTDNKMRLIDLSGLDLSELRKSMVFYTDHVRFIKLSNCKLRVLPEIMPTTASLIQELDFSYNFIQQIDGRSDYYFPLSNLRLLNASSNTQLVAVGYLQFYFLETLDLSHTALSELDKSFLSGLPNLKHLDLSSSRIRIFYREMVVHAVLRTLDLRELELNNFCKDFFNGLTIIEHLYTASFELCCPQIRGENIPYHTCHAPSNAISSCFDLLGLSVQRVLLWTVAVLAVLGNMTVIGYRVFWDRSVLRTGYGLFVTNLGISDFIMGVYLFIIAGADFYYRGVYVLHDKIWRESVACRLAGFLATVSSETSMFFIFLITLDRFLVMKFPFGQIRFSTTGTFVALSLSWITGLLLALVPVASNLRVYSSNAMCLALPLATKRIKGWEFSFVVFVALNMFLCLAIAYGQRAVFQAMSANRITGTPSSTTPRRIEDIMVAKQLSLVAVSNFLCWFPIGVGGLMALCQHEIGDNAYAWITVIVLPINSAANPLLYTIPVLLTKWEKFKSGGRCSHPKTSH